MTTHEIVPTDKMKLPYGAGEARMVTWASYREMMSNVATDLTDLEILPSQENAEVDDDAAVLVIFGNALYQREDGVLDACQYLRGYVTAAELEQWITTRLEGQDEEESDKGGKT